LKDKSQQDEFLSETQIGFRGCPLGDNQALQLCDKIQEGNLVWGKEFFSIFFSE
jgi:hypothetical protein